MNKEKWYSFTIMDSGRIKTIFCCVLVLLISYFTYFDGYYKADTVIFDEHYYIVHAERYLNGIVFFDVNPPLGKMFIALGEKIFNANSNVDIKKPMERGYLYLEDVENLSGVGFRFFPTLFGFFNGLLVFLIFYGLSKNNFLSLMFSSLYLFENSSIVHFRAAMLDSTLVFFSLLTILYFIYLYEKKDKKTLSNYFVLGLFTGLAMLTKMVGAILVLLPVFLFFGEFGWRRTIPWINLLGRIFKRAAYYALAIFMVGFTVYYVHIALGSKVLEDENGVSDGGVRLGASQKYAQMVKEKDIYNPFKMYVPMKDYFRHIKASQKLLPKLTDKPSEIASNPLGWPIGIKNISYTADVSDESNKWWYLNFQGNPVNWSLGLLAVLLSIGLITTKTFSRSAISNMRTYRYILIFTALYVGYMTAITLLSLQRVLYIHTYFLPLFFSFILSFLVFNYIFEEYVIKKDRVLFVSLFLLVAQIIYVFYCISPITYAKPISYLDCERTRLIDFWEDDCVEH